MSARPIRIAGAGPAGLCAALALARAGVPVELREKRAGVGARFAGAVHGIENWSTPACFTARLAEWGIELGATLTPCHELMLCGERRTRTITAALPLFFLVRRGADAGCLEQALQARALDAGAKVSFRATFAPGEAELDATGARRERRLCLEAGVHFRTRSPDRAAALVSSRATPSGYAYLLVRDGFGSLCAVRFDGRPVDREQLAACERLLRRHVEIDMTGRRPGAGFGSFCAGGQLEGQGAWAIGEAAGLQDLLFGFGIRRALESAELAARCLRQRADYPRLAVGELGLLDRAPLVNRALWDVTAPAGMRLYAHLLCRQGDVRRALRGATSERWIHRALHPLLAARWRRRRPELFTG